MSADGFIATADGGVGWLAQFQAHDYGFDAFFGAVGAVVMGRATYDQVVGFGGPWPYAGRPTVVLTSRPLVHPPAEVEPWSGPVGPLAERLRGGSGGDVWVVGGAKAHRAFLDAGAVDRIDLFVMPILLGAGMPLFESGGGPHALALDHATPLAGGAVHLAYRVGAGGQSTVSSS